MRKIVSLVTLALITGSGNAALADGFGRMSRDGGSTYQQQNWMPTVAPNLSWQEQQARNAARQSAALQAQRDSGYSPNGTGLADRWQAEYRAAHPGEPMPSFGQIEKMHEAETLNNINRGFNNMRARRQQELNRNMGWSKELYAKNLGKSVGSLTPAEQRDFAAKYENGQRAQAEAYKEGIRQAGEHYEAERADRERREIYTPYR